MKERETSLGHEQLRTHGDILSQVKTNLGEAFNGFDQSVHPPRPSSKEVGVIPDLIERTQYQKNSIKDDGSLDVGAYQKLAMERIEAREPSERVADWLVLTAIDIEMANQLKDDESMVFPSVWNPNFTKESLRGGKMALTKHDGCVVVAPEELDWPANKDLRGRFIGDVGGNVTIDLHVLPGLDERDVTLVKLALGAEQKLDPQSPEYQAYFMNTTLGRGKIQANKVWNSETPVIREARHQGETYKTNIPGLVLDVVDDIRRRSKKGKFVSGYYVFPDRLQQAQAVIDSQEGK